MKRIVALVIIALMGVGVFALWRTFAVASERPQSAVTSVIAVPTTPPGQSDPAAVAAALAALPSLGVKKLTPQPGYDLSCSPGHACSFGQRWTDDYDGPSGRNGCGGRDDVLAQQLSDVQRRNECVVVGGVFTDPYSGEIITFSKDQASQVPIDHVYARKLAWDMGAWAWPIEKRIQFANDTELNLVVTTQRMNSSKSDDGPSVWLLRLTGERGCDYASRFTLVAARYGLFVTGADEAALRRTLTVCAR